MQLLLRRSADMAAETRSSTPLLLHSTAALPSFRALSRLFCSSQGKSASSMGVLNSSRSFATADVHSKVKAEKLPKCFFYEYFWSGPGWSMTREFEAVRNKYPKIQVEKVDISMFLGERERPKLFGFLNVNFLGERERPKLFGFLNVNITLLEVIKRTMLVMGRDVKQLEAAVERRKKFRSLSATLKDLIWNRQQQQQQQ